MKRVRPLHRPRSAIPGTSWNGSTDKLWTKEDHHLAAFFAPGIMVPFFSPNYEYQTFKICVSDLQNSLFRPSKFAFQTFEIRFSDLRNSLFRPSKFALQGFKIRASRLKQISLKMDRNSRLWAKILFQITNEEWRADKYSLDKTSAFKYIQRGRGRLRLRPLCICLLFILRLLFQTIF